MKFYFYLNTYFSLKLIIRRVILNYVFTSMITHHHYHQQQQQQSILPKGRFFTAYSGTKVAVLFKGRTSTTNSGTQPAVLLGMDRCDSFPLFSASTLSLASEQTLRYLIGFQGHYRGGEESGFG